MRLAVEAVVPEEEGSAEEDDPCDEPADEEDEHHDQLVLASLAHLLNQLEVGGGELGIGLADCQTALLPNRHTR